MTIFGGTWLARRRVGNVASIALFLLLVGVHAGASGQSDRQKFAEMPSQAWADRDELRTVSALPSDVITVITGGCWSKGDQEGFYRIIVNQGGFEELYHHLYVQIVEIDAERHDFRVRKTEPVKETAGFALVLHDLRLSSPATKCGDAIFEADTHRRTLDGDRNERMRLRLRSDGTYTVTFEPAGPDLH